MIDWNVTALVPHNGVWYYVENGCLNWSYNGIADGIYGGQFYVLNGVYNTGFTGLYLYNDVWYYLQNGTVASDFTGLVQHVDGNWYYVKNGKIDWSVTALVPHTDGNWYYVDHA